MQDGIDAVLDLTDEQVDAIRDNVERLHVHMTTGILSWCSCGVGKGTPTEHNHERHIVRVIATLLAGGDDE